MKIFNIVTKKEYEKNGQVKKQWNTVGRLVHFPASDRGDEGYKLEVFMQPDTQFYVFEQKERGGYSQPQAAPQGEPIESEDPKF